MSFKLLILGSFHQEYFNQYYLEFPYIKSCSFKEQYDHLIEDTQEMMGIYVKMYEKLGVSAKCIIGNAVYLQKQWASENGNKFRSQKELLFEQIKKINPDVLQIDDHNFIDKSWINNLRNEIPGIRLVIANHCAPFNSTVIEKLRNLDFVITCTPGLKDAFERKGLKSFMVYHAFNPEVLKRLERNDLFPHIDFVFSGSLFLGGGFHKARIELIEKIFNEKIDLKIYGKLESNTKIKAKQSVYHLISILTRLKIGNLVHNIPLLRRYEEYGFSEIKNYSDMLVKSSLPPVYGLNMLRILKNSKVTLNNHGEVAGEYAGNMRLFEATGVGSCLITDNKKNMKDLFSLGDEVVVYDTQEECVAKIKWLLNNDSEREKIAKAGQLKTLRSHTVEKRCNTLIEIILKELKR